MQATELRRPDGRTPGGDGTDYGTPARTGAPGTLAIDGRDVTVPAGNSVLRAANAAGNDKPKH